MTSIVINNQLKVISHNNVMFLYTILKIKLSIFTSMIQQQN